MLISAAGPVPVSTSMWGTWHGQLVPIQEQATLVVESTLWGCTLNTTFPFPTKSMTRFSLALAMSECTGSRGLQTGHVEGPNRNHTHRIHAWGSS